MPTVFRPEGSPECWGRLYEAHTWECRNCPYEGSCKAQFGRSTALVPAPAPPRSSMPVAYQAPAPPPMPAHMSPAPQPAIQQPQMFRYSAPTNQPAGNYQFNQYPGETVTERLAKNVFLRMLEMAFNELMMFFRHWTWPKRK